MEYFLIMVEYYILLLFQLKTSNMDYIISAKVILYTLQRDLEIS